MQAKLPDINGAIVTYRKAILNALDNGDFQKAAIVFDDLISLMPEEYRVEINTIKYNKLKESKYNIVCTECKMDVQTLIDGQTKIEKQLSEFPRKDIRPFEILLPDMESLIIGEKTIMVWVCPNCGKIKPLKDSPTKLIKYHDQSYFKVIPEPPVRRGMHDRLGSMQRNLEWYNTCSREIEHQVGLYRAEYAQQVEMKDEDLPNE